MPTPLAVSALDALDAALFDIRRALQRPGYRRRLLEASARPIELATLRTLRAVEQREGEGPSIGDIAEVLGVAPSTASRTVDRCVGAGLLTRIPCPVDRRRSRLQLTSDGRALLDRVTAARRTLLAEVTRDWRGEDAARLTELLGALLVGFDRLEEAR